MGEADAKSEVREDVLGPVETEAGAEVAWAGSDVELESISSKKLGLPGLSSEVSGVVFSVFIHGI